MKLIPDNTSIDFLNRTPRTIALGIAALLVVVSLASLIMRGMEFGIDFTGGVLLEVGYPEEADLDRIRQLMAESGYDDVQVQRFGAATDVMLRLPPQPDLDPNAVRESLSDILTADNPGVQLRRVEFVGPQVGEDLREQGATAVIFALCMIFIYIMFRFQWKFSAGAVAALLHDIIITLGFFSIFGLQFDLTVLAGLLAVIGYSLNDTVVVFDRIRENFISMRGATTLDAMNRSINDTLSRTIITGITTLLVLVALYYLGGESVRSFSTALIVGIVIGTFSSVYVASALSLSLGISAKDLLPPEKDSKLIDDLP
ncbi:MAG TPA: protein translocase subunit SecF [Woeseiaceae bacterium]|nr:protein translocase subunit SecF [Woeseiaceae bacterium]